MINFFRKIRKQLAADNKPLKYMRYAIGEIVLVVVGILIALQINNWNEFKKERKQEFKVLAEIRDNLIKGREILEDSYYWDSILTQSSLIVLEHLKNDLKYHDSLVPHFRAFPNTLAVKIPSTGFDNLKSEGLTLIRNDSIRISLSNLYDYSSPLLSEYWHSDVGMRRTEIYNSELYEHFLRTDPILGDSIFGRQPINYNELIQDMRFESLVRSTIMTRYWYKNQKENARQEIIELIGMINQELKMQ